MSIILKNKTPNDIEINDLGILLPSNELYELDKDGVSESPELQQYVERGDVVYVEATHTGEFVEKTPEESIEIVKAASGVDLTVFYLKSEIDELMNRKADVVRVYDRSELYTKQEIDNIVETITGGAPELLDTLSEISAALGNDANFATTVTNELANKANAIHDHDDRYFTRGETSQLLMSYAPVEHTHDDLYANKFHSHPEYSSSNHNHDNVYSKLNHNHDNVYAPIIHNHDAMYAKLKHNHDSEYYKKSYIDDRFNQIVYGRNYTYAESPEIVTHTTTRLFEKIRMDVTISERGYYKINWFYMWNVNSTYSDFCGIVELDTTTLFKHVQESKDSSGSFGSTGTDQQMPVSGFKRIYLEPGTYSFTVKFASTKNNIKVSMWDARLEFMRVE